MFFSASRRLRPLSRPSCARTKRRISAASVQAYCLSAQPIALRMKNSWSSRLRSMHAYSRSRFVRSLKVIWQMMAVQRFHRFSAPLHRRMRTVIVRGQAASSGPIRWMATASTKSHHAPSTIICSYMGSAPSVWNRR